MRKTKQQQIEELQGELAKRLSREDLTALRAQQQSKYDAIGGAIQLIDWQIAELDKGPEEE
jgi:hypothetical protein